MQRGQTGADIMKIEHVINNNVVSIFENGLEVVISGRGIGFGKRSGDPVDESRIEKIFRISNEERLGKFKDLLVKVPLEYLKISDGIITRAREELNIPLNENIYITLTDHINFALERYDQGMDFENILTHEVKSFYPNEFRIGLQAVKLIEEKTGKFLKEDEAASIALHIVSAELSTRTSIAFEITQAVQKILEIVSEKVDISDPETKSKLDNLIPTFKHFVFRIIKEKQYARDDPALYAFVKSRYTDEDRCCEEIVNYIERHFHRVVTIDERTYIIILLRKMEFEG